MSYIYVVGGSLIDLECLIEVGGVYMVVVISLFVNV